MTKIYNYYILYIREIVYIVGKTEWENISFDILDTLVCSIPRRQPYIETKAITLSANKFLFLCKLYYNDK